MLRILVSEFGIENVFFTGVPRICNDLHNLLVHDYYYCMIIAVVFYACLM